MDGMINVLHAQEELNMIEDMGKYRKIVIQSTEDEDAFYNADEDGWLETCEVCGHEVGYLRPVGEGGDVDALWVSMVLKAEGWESPEIEGCERVWDTRCNTCVDKGREVSN